VVGEDKEAKELRQKFGLPEQARKIMV